MNLDGDVIRKAIEEYLGCTHFSLQVAWNMSIPKAIEVCAYEHFLNPKKGKAQKDALETIRQAAENLEKTGTYHGGVE